MRGTIYKKKPIANSSRNTVLENKRNMLSADKSMTYRKFNKGGKNNSGKITVRHHGGGNKVRIRKVTHRVDTIKSVIGEVYDPHRSAKVSLVINSKGEKDMRLQLDNTTPYVLGDLDIGTYICNFEITPESNSKICRAAGVTAKIINKDENNVYIQLPSSEIRMFNRKCRGYLGSIPFAEYRYLKTGKAGRNRLNNIRPVVRGVAQKQNSHPNGSESGKNKGKLQKTIYGQLAKGGRTRINNSRFTIVNSRGKKIRSIKN